jgi:hypothetical protein
MPLEAGSVFVRIAGLFVKSEFDKADKAVAAQRAAAKDPIVYRITAETDGITADVAKARVEANAEAKKPVDIPVGVSTAGLAAEIVAAREQVKRGISTGTGAGAGQDPNVIRLNEDDRKLLRSYTEGTGSRRESHIYHHSDSAALRAANGVQGAERDASEARRAERLGPGELLHGLLHAPGGFKGLGGMSLGSMIGLGPEHLLTAGAAFAGTLGPALGGAGLALGGAAAREAVGGGSDALIQHTTRANAEAIYKDMVARNAVIEQYGKNSKEAAAAQATFNQQVAAFGKGPGIAAEVQLDKNVSHLSDTYKKTSQGAQAESAEFYEQIINFAQKMLPFVIQSAQRNLGELDKDIRPLFKWLSGPEGMGIFKGLENDFAKNLPVSIHAFTQGLELILKLFGDASAQSGGLSKKLNNFFTDKNAESAKQLDDWVKKLLGDMHDWGHLLDAIGRAFSGIMKVSAHEGIGLVNGLTKVIDKFDQWERSAKGSVFLKSFFGNRSKELDALLKTIGPLLGVFFQFYRSVQILVPGVTDFLIILTKILNAVANLGKHSKVFEDAFILPMGAFLLIWKRFGWEKAVGLVKSLASGFGLLGKKTTEAADAQKGFNKEREASGAAGDAEGAVGDAERRGGAAGLADKLLGGTRSGLPGTPMDPLVVVEEDAKYSGLGNRAKDYDASDSSVVNRVREATGEKTIGGAGIAGDAAGAGDVAGDVAGGGGLLAGLGGLGSIAAIAAPIAAVVAAVVGLAKATGTLGHLKDEVVKPFADAWKEVEGAIDSALGGGGKAGDMFKQIGKEATIAWDAIKNFVDSSGFKSGMEVFENIIGEVAKIFSDVLVTNIKDGIDIIVAVIKTFIADVKGIVDVFKGVFEIIKGIVTLNGGDIEKGFADIGKGIWTVLKSALEVIPHLFGELFTNALNEVLSIFGIHSPSTVFASIGKSLVDGIMGVLDGLPGMFLHLGENVIKSIIKGIGSGAKKVGDAIKGAVTGGVHDAEHLGGKVLHDLDPLHWGARGMQLPGFEGGGRVPGREYGLTDRMTLVDPSGRARARMAGDESIYTRHQRPYVDAGLRAIGIGGSEGLWSRVTTPHSYSGGGSPPFGADLQLFAGGGTIKPSTAHRTMTASGLTTNATLSKFGQSALNAVATKVSNLDNKYTDQSNIYSLYSDGGSGTPSVKDLGVLMGIREQQWDLLYNEWLTLPAALKSLQHQAYGYGSSGTGGIRANVKALTSDIDVLQTLVSDIGGDAKPTTDSSSAAYQKLKSYYKGQTPTSVASTARSNATIAQANARTHAANVRDQGIIDKQSSSADANIPGGPSAATMNNVYKTNAGLMAGYTSQLVTIHKQSLQLTQQIISLIPQAKKASRSQRDAIRKRIGALRTQRVNNNNKATTVVGQLSDLQTTNETVAVQYKDGSYYNRMARAAIATGLTGKTTELENVLRQLQTALSAEEKLESDAVNAIASIKGKIGGDGSDGESVVDQLSDYGYDIMGLNQQGAKVPQKYQSEIDKVFKALGIQIPANWASAAATAQATTGEQSLQSFQSSLSSTFGSFGSNFVAAGANPYKGKAGRLAGMGNYGATGYEGGGEMGSGTPYGGTGGDTNINITQHFGGPPPDPHTYSHGLNYELQSAIG